MNPDILAPRYRRMAQNNRWSNFRLLSACARLAAPEFAAPRVGFFPSLQATLNHILIVDRYYIDALTEGGLGRAAFAREIPCPDFADLAQAQFEADTALLSYCAGLDDAHLAAPVRLDRGARGMLSESAENVLLHLFLHQTHHRGQAHAMLSATRVAPPQLDEFYLDDDEPVRRDEVAVMAHMAFRVS